MLLLLLFVYLCLGINLFKKTHNGPEEINQQHNGNDDNNENP